MGEAEPDAARRPRPRVLIPVDAEEAMRALARFAYSAERANVAGSPRPALDDGDG